MDDVRHTIRFILGGQIEVLRSCQPSRTVLEFLREDKGLKGTKEGCAEGDCGACTVVIGELHGDSIRYTAVNSCIQFLPTLDGKLLLSVEDLARKDAPLHAVQQAMVDQHGSQCGFCTPGFVMSLFAMFHNQPDRQVTRTEIEQGLAGNLCRCTGYAPIVRAAEDSLSAGRSDCFMQAENKIRDQLVAIQDSQPLQLDYPGQRFYAPRCLDELCKLLVRHPQAVMVAGATDVGLWVSKQLRKLKTVIYLGEVTELKRVKDDGTALHLGAAVTYSDATPALVRHYPAFAPLLERLGATQVRNTGTVGGNIANGSPIGDMPPGLIAAGASLVLRSTGGQRVIALEDFFIAYGQQDLRAGECIEQVIVPAPVAHQLFAIYKISKRFEQDISALCGAFALQIENEIITRARVCFGGMAEIPKRARQCEQALNGQPWKPLTIDAAMLAMKEDYTPLTDMRASSAYRLQAAQNLLQRFYLEHSSRQYPVRLGA